MLRKTLLFFLLGGFLISAGKGYCADKWILLVPAGNVDSGVLYEIRSALKSAFGRDVDMGSGIRLPSEAYDSYRRQFSSTMIITSMEGYDLGRKMTAYDKYERMLVVVDVDIFVRGLNFVFGEADPGKKRAVISLTRLREEYYGRAPDRALLYFRAAKEAVHELGHTYGLGHCGDKTCVMYFSNTLKDTDKKSVSFCPSCRKALDRKLSKGTY